MSAAESTSATAHERTDGAPGVIVRVAIALAVGIAATLGVSAWLYAARYGDLPSARFTGPESSFQHGPDQRTSLQRDWIAQDAAVRQNLETYGWIDREAGIVRIPIERAIEVLAAEARPQEGTR